MNEKKIGIITFHRANNYGAVLQNYALQQAINNIGYRAETIDYRCEAIDKQYEVHIFQKQKNIIITIKGIVGNLLNYFQEKRRYFNFEKFRIDNLKISEKIYRKNFTNFEEEKYSVIVTGSDQVWNKEIFQTKNSDAYFLSFVKKVPTASYAASAGNAEKIDTDMLSRIKKIDYITVRENSLNKYLHEKIEKMISTVCDPVFLLKKEQWENKLDIKTLDKSKTLFLYFIDYGRSEACEIAKTISNSHKLKIVYPVRKQNGTLGLGKCIYSDSPFKFLHELYAAEYIVASSFHAVAFSVIFQKKFVALLHNKTGSRVRDLLEKVGLQDRLVESYEDYVSRSKELEEINYEKVGKQLDEWIDFSYKELKNICNLSK